MTIKHLRILSLAISLAIALAGNTQVRLAFLTNEKDITTQRELTEALAFAGKLPGIHAEAVFLNDLRDATSLAAYGIVWYHATDSSNLFTGANAVKAVKDFYDNGGKVLLSGEACRWINLMKIEKNDIQARSKALKDEGYGRMAGFHTFRDHPIFKGLNGGAYILKPKHDTVVRQLGYFDDDLPATGEVVAVDWDYIFVRESSKLVLSYRNKEGLLLAVGGYMCFSAPNINRKHLEHFTSNVFEWLKTGRDDGYHWSYGPQEVKKGSFNLAPPPQSPPVRWNFRKELPEITKNEASDNFWDVAGERTLVMGKEKSGIEEIWMHPVMTFRDIEAGIVIGGSGRISWLKDLVPMLKITPAYFQRTYTIQGSTLTETVMAHHQAAAAVVHYEYIGRQPAEIFIKYTSNLRLMWPYSENVLKSLNYSFSKDINGIVIADESQSFAGIVGSNKTIASHEEGQHTFIEPEQRGGGWSYNVQPSGEFVVKGCFSIELAEKDQADIVFSGSSNGTNDCAKTYGSVLRKADKTFDLMYASHVNFSRDKLSIVSPDPVFNEGISWAMHAADRFKVYTPGLGTSLVAGYGTTASGWDGGHKVNGRPGYAWYFGRDGVWSGFALLDYGDFDNVRYMLEFFGKYQDLNGKIFHELTTSGFAHYDAADATPLYIILAGRYLRHTGDTWFIKRSWPNIKAAIDFCFSTDTDGDHLIENTNTGHGWVEGGNLFGSHTSLYLASCWAEALKEAAYMAEALRMKRDELFYAEKYRTVRDIINKEFYNPGTKYFSHGKLADGSYMEEASIMPSIPMLFGQLDEEKTGHILDKFAGSGFTSDWGCRILEESSPFFNPRGYHTGSVWPLFTGWTSLAEYQYGNDIQGYSHLYSNLLIYLHWGLGFTEEVLNGKQYLPSGVCHHQCWSETMVIQPVIEGMLGLKPDAVHSKLLFSPRFPAGWDSVQVNKIQVGKHVVDFTMKRSNDDIAYTFHHNGDGTLDIRFIPDRLPGMELTSLHYSGDHIDTVVVPQDTLHFWLRNQISLTYNYKGGVSLLPLHYYPIPGDTTEGPRIISEKYEKNVYEAEVQGLQGTENSFEIYGVLPVKKLENCSLVSENVRKKHIRVIFRSSEEKWVTEKIRVYVD